MRISWLSVALWMALASAASGQRLHWGVIGGTGLTPDFPRYEDSGPGDVYGNPAYYFQHLPGPRSLILGGLLEVQLTRSLAVEVDILHRPLRTNIIETIMPAGGGSVTSANNYVAANTWEFPMMLKWNLPRPLARGRYRPFLEGGFAYRTSQDDSAVLPKQFGITAGAGVNTHFGRVRIAPTIRYTRWQKETHFPPYPSRADQFEFLTSVAWGTSPDPLQIRGHRMSLGVVGGLSAIGEFYYPETGVRERVGFLVGASGQLELRQGLALEVDAIYKPMRASLSEGQGFTVLTWDFPVLAKFHVARLGQAPFVEAGPSFRAAGNLNGYNPSHFGATIGVGAETHAGWMRMSTALRYTRWAKDSLPRYRGGSQHDYPRTNVNTVELVGGISF